MPDYTPEDKELLVALGLRIKSERIKRNISQEALAESSGLHRTYIGSAERGERNVSLINLTKIAHALDVSVGDLVSDGQP